MVKWNLGLSLQFDCDVLGWTKDWEGQDHNQSIASRSETFRQFRAPTYRGTRSRRGRCSWTRWCEPVSWHETCTARLSTSEAVRHAV